VAGWKDAPVARKRSTPPCLPGHQHFWEIDPANGPLSHGVCKYCKLEGLHSNYIGIGTAYERHDQWKKTGVDRLTSVL
tara:strand:+ start:373 stop:606 length:234 start_codon:yes stop_codon:yes gene_type:complete